MNALIDPNDLMLPTHYGDKAIPHAAWTTLRAESPVHWCEVDERQSFWAITKYADIMDISGRPNEFSNAALRPSLSSRAEPLRQIRYSLA